MHSCRERLSHLTLSSAQNAALILARYLKEQKQEGGDAGEKARQELLDAAREAVKKKAVGDLYRAAFERRKKLMTGVGETFHVASRMIVGLGSSNVLETGLTLNFIYGAPIIPGSALKGLAAHYCSTMWGTDPDFKGPEKDKKGNVAKPAGKYYDFMFGSTEDAGFLTFHDAWITPKSLPDSLIQDVMTPHHGDYYMGKTAGGQRCAPSDFDDPNPVTFLSVRGDFDIYISCDGEDGEQKKEWEKLAMDLLKQALSDWGIGGKTSSGYGAGKFAEVSAAPIAPQNPLVGKTVEVRCTGKNKKGNPQFEVEVDGKKIRPTWKEKAPEVQETIQAVVVSYTPGNNPQLVLTYTAQPF
ncbi:MAG: type III-B CRISPR module RAMP protein Cmr6 [Synergistaceae bacterium]|jgi:CRISPR-associated protein Cmr6|nr:type III-B CRISPR module RAMP protein Cmr6 [Synergistaceae bacterium]